jgi:hypothetical protein
VPVVRNLGASLVAIKEYDVSDQPIVRDGFSAQARFYTILFIEAMETLAESEFDFPTPLLWRMILTTDHGSRKLR